MSNETFDDVEIIDSESRVLTPTGGGMIQTKGTYTTAMRVAEPRKLAMVERRLLEEAALAGEDFYYGWGVGKDSIEGPSQSLAHAAARCWGNCAVEVEDLEETPAAFIFTAAFLDLETGFTLSRKFRQSRKWTVYGKLDEERKEDIRFQIGQSKATRNVILKALPQWLIDKAMRKAKEGVRAKLEKFIAEKGMAGAIDLIAKEMAKLGVTKERIALRFSVADVNGLSLENLVTLRGDLRAIQDGQERAEALYPPEPDASPQAEGTKSKQAAAAMKGRRKKQEDKPQDTGPENTAQGERSPESENAAGDAPGELGQGPTIQTEDAAGGIPSYEQLLQMIAKAESVMAVQGLQQKWCHPNAPLPADEKQEIAEWCQKRIAALVAETEKAAKAADQGSLPLTGGYRP